MSELTRINILREKLGWGEKEIEELCKELEFIKRNQKETIEHDNRRNKAVKLLNQIGVSYRTKGRKYILEGVLYILQHGEVKITRELYPQIAKKFNTSPVNVERDIRVSIDNCFKRKNNLLTEIFEDVKNSRNGRVTNGEFIYGLVSYLSNY